MRNSEPNNRVHLVRLALRGLLPVATLVTAMVTPLSARAAYLSVYGGPAYNQTTKTGYESPDLPVAPGATAGNGTAVGGQFKYVGGQGYGARAVRWDASGSAPTELGILDTNSNGATQPLRPRRRRPAVGLPARVSSGRQQRRPRTRNPCSTDRRQFCPPAAPTPPSISRRRGGHYRKPM